MSESMKITPNCRYGHGDLVRLVTPVRPNNTRAQFAYIASGTTIMFTGDLYLCPHCGYSEFFDDEVEATLEQQQSVEDRT